MLAAAFLAGLFLLPTLPAAAQNSDEVAIDHEVWSVIGWNDACGVAFSVLSYPKLGEAMTSEPFSTRVGALAVPVQKERASGEWTLEADGPLSFSQKAFDKAVKDLKKGGYTRPGFPETIPRGPIGRQPLLAETILSTSTLSPRLKGGWPGPEWRWAGANYNPLATCALLVFENRAAPRRYSFLLIRVYNPRARTDRAYAHASNARLLFEDGSLDEGYAESENAAKLAPDLAIARYQHAAMLALTGRANEAVAELQAAVTLEPKYRAKARADADFADLRRRDDFKDATR